MLPNPTADPAAAKMKPTLPENPPRFDILNFKNVKVDFRFDWISDEVNKYFLNILIPK